jgi:hypothetical protein
MSRRQPKAEGPSSSKNPTVASDAHNDSPQDLAAPERQQNSDYNDAPEDSSQQTLQEQVYMLTRNQSRTETVLEQLLTRITEISNPV